MGGELPHVFEDTLWEAYEISKTLRTEAEHAAMKTKVIIEPWLRTC